MPPKQATLGYVKSSQQTLGCMLPSNPTLEHIINHITFRKFFGQTQNGSKPNPQQSKLAFNPPKASKSADARNDVVDGVQALGKGSDRSLKGKDLNGDTITNSDTTLKKEATNGHTEELDIESLPGVKEEKDHMEVDTPPDKRSSPKRSNSEIKDEDDEDEEPVRKRSRRREPGDEQKQLAKKVDPGNPPETVNSSSVGSNDVKVEPKAKASTTKKRSTSRNAQKDPTLLKPRKSEEVDDLNSKSSAIAADDPPAENDVSEVDEEAESDEEDEEKPEVAAKAREKVQSTLKSNGKDPYPDWAPGEPVPYAALCTTFSMIEMTTKRLVISAHCSLFLRQVLRLTPQDLLPTVQLMINKLAADYAGIELGIGESLIMKAIGETTGRSLQIIKADQNEIGDLGLVAAKSRSNQPTMFKPKPLTVRGVLEGLMNIAVIQGDGSQGRKIAGIKKLLSAADAATAGKGNKGVDITKDKGGASEAKFIVRFLEGKLRLGLAEKTVLVALAHAMVIHETEKKGNKLPSSEQLAKGESILKTVYR